MREKKHGIYVFPRRLAVCQWWGPWKYTYRVVSVELALQWSAIRPVQQDRLCVTQGSLRFCLPLLLHWRRNRQQQRLRCRTWVVDPREERHALRGANRLGSSLGSQLTSRHETDSSAHLDKRNKQHHLSSESRFNLHTDPKRLTVVVPNSKTTRVRALFTLQWYLDNRPPIQGGVLVRVCRADWLNFSVNHRVARGNFCLQLYCTIELKAKSMTRAQMSNMISCRSSGGMAGSGLDASPHFPSTLC